MREELFAISGLRARYPQCFIVNNGIYQFVGLWETVEKLVECDSMPDDVLAAHPEINTFTSVFFGGESTRLTPLAKRQAERRGKIDKIGRQESLRYADGVLSNQTEVEKSKSTADPDVSPCKSPRRSIVSMVSRGITKRLKVLSDRCLEI